MQTLYRFQFVIGFETVLEGSQEMINIRRLGQEIAKEKGKNVKVFLYNDPLGHWDMVGTDLPNGLHLDAYGNLCKLDEDGRNYWKVKE